MTVVLVPIVAHYGTNGVLTVGLLAGAILILHNPTCVAAPSDPGALRQLLVHLRKVYGTAFPPVTITENGCSVAEDAVPDQPRIDYLTGHLDALAQAVAEGIDARGYYVWSLIDNLEWAEGFSQRFGLVHVDFETQRRTLRASYAWYRDLIAAHRKRFAK